jgi:hypothetical protein
MSADANQPADRRPPVAGAVALGVLRAVGRSLWRRRLALAGALAVAAFVVLTGRFWHPYYGFTRFVQLDAPSVEIGIHEIREQPVYVYRDTGGYDGLSYLQLAFHPLLDSPELKGALDNANYRARRILGSALTWLLAGGDAARIAQIYPALNLGVWLILAGLLWVLLPVRDARGWIAWAGLLFSAGALHSVRLALTDLLALTALALAMLMWERRWRGGAARLLAAAALARETALLSLAAFAPLERAEWRNRRAWLRFALRAVVVVVPLALWMAYVRARLGPADAGWGNFGFPLLGWLEKWPEMVHAWGLGKHRWLVVTSVLATVGVTAQAVYFIARRRIEDPWWRIGIVHVLLFAVLGFAVWEGHPGAATRVLLPLGLAFAVMVVRRRESLVWLLAGNLGVFAGVEALREVPWSRDELGAGRSGAMAYTVRADDGFHGRESYGGHAWSWCGERGTLEVLTAPAAAGPLRVRLRLQGAGQRTLGVRDASGLLWTGVVGDGWQPLEIGTNTGPDGRARLEFFSREPAVPESDVPGARTIAFGVLDVRVLR